MIIKDILGIFSPDLEKIIITENKDLCEAYVSFNNTGGYCQATIDDELAKIPRRDNCTLTILKDDVIIYSSGTNEESIEEVLDDKIYGNELMVAKIRIDKNIDSCVLSVYDYSSFVQYLENLSLKSFLNVFESFLALNSLTFERYDGDVFQWNTKSLAVRPEGAEPLQVFSTSEFRNDIRYSMESMCHWDNNIDKVIPYDFFIENGQDNNDPLQRLFFKASALLMLMFLFDYTKLDNEFLQYKLTGYKTIIGNLEVSKISEVKYNADRLNTLRDVFCWCYDAGQRSEKLGVARNVLSLESVFPYNANSNEIDIEETAFEGIRSNYRFFEKEHLREFIEWHGKLIESIFSLQEKVIAAVDGFVKEFKQGFFVTISFIITSIVIRSVNHDAFLSKPLLWISALVILVYFFSFIYYSGDLKGKIQLSKNQYNKIRKRYEPLLTPEENNEIFGDENSYGESIEFAESQLKKYTEMWRWLCIAMFSIVIFLIFYNGIIAIIIATVSYICDYLYFNWGTFKGLINKT